MTTITLKNEIGLDFIEAIKALVKTKPKDFYTILKKKAEEECTTVSFLIRRMIIKDIREGDEEHE